MKIFRLIDLQGKPSESSLCNTLETSKLKEIYKVMVKCEEMDQILYKAQRQGKISFYMTSFGETACIAGSAAGLNSQDLLFPQYREQAALLWRGFTIQEFTNQCAGNKFDPAKGRQMPVHYGSDRLNVATISSPLATQIPQASGAGYTFRVAGQDRIAATYFGDGSASEGDFHSALNFASTLKCQTMFLCRNNGYAISTHISEQYNGDGIAGRGMSAYGIKSLRVDGNDALASYYAVKTAREYIVKEKSPFLIEFMTYRISDHSTSDHSVLYRTENEINEWDNLNNPIIRLRKYLVAERGLVELVDEEKEMRDAYRKETIEALKFSSTQKLPSPHYMFEDVYSSLTPNLVEQAAQLKKHLEKHNKHYPLEKYEE